jgi:hypothetical protein
MRAREGRFLGKAREWQITCPQCKAVSKPIKTGSGRSMPPEMVVKKLKQAGWQVGDKPRQDLCPNCISKPIKSRVKTAAQTLRDVQAPVVTVNGAHHVHFADLKVAAGQLAPEHAKELIELLRQQLPQKPRREKPPASPREPQTEYDAWLNEIDRSQ